jgi:hypothetical protein
MTPLLGYYGNRWQDHVMLRRVGNILLALWICIVNICRKIKGDSSKKSPSRQTITEFSRTHEEWKVNVIINQLKTIKYNRLTGMDGKGLKLKTLHLNRKMMFLTYSVTCSPTSRNPRRSIRD